VTITESTGTVRKDETKCQLGKRFGDDFRVDSDSVFDVDFRVN
jgi:hypothetical protein